MAKSLTIPKIYDNNIINGGKEKWKDYLKKNYLIGKNQE